MWLLLLLLLLMMMMMPAMKRLDPPNSMI